jgi:hypothetical protein
MLVSGNNKHKKTSVKLLEVIIVVSFIIFIPSYLFNKYGALLAKVPFNAPVEKGIINSQQQSSIRVNQTIKADFFDKKLTCAKYFDKIKVDLALKEKDYFQTESKSAITRLLGYDDFLVGFYSPKLNTCLYAVARRNDQIDANPDDLRQNTDNEPKRIKYIIYDALTTETIKTFPESDSGAYAKFLYDYSGGDIKI